MEPVTKSSSIFCDRIQLDPRFFFSLSLSLASMSLDRRFLSIIFFFLLIQTLEARSISDGTAVEIAGTAVEIADAAVDLNSSSFASTLKDSPANFAIVEFFAHWCPACRNYKPHYEKVARLFNGPNAVHPGIVIMARVDCANKMNTDLCDKFKIGHYPLLLWGPPAKFADGRWDSKQKNSEILSIDDGRTAELLLNWINKRIGSSFSLDDEKYENEYTLSQNASDPEQIARAIYDVEEATATAFDIIMEHKMVKSDTRAPLIKFFQLLVAHHPSKRCRRGTAELLVNFDELWPEDVYSISSAEVGKSHERDILKSYRICGTEVPRGYWIFCRGSKNETRGFSCGLWVLLHSLSLRAGDGESHFAFTSICDFIRKFFICDECRRHFGAMCSSVSVPINSTRDLALWLWSTHNKVNERLMKEERDLGTGDPKFPKMVWPTKQLCPSCHLSRSSKSGEAVKAEWDYDEVFHFLARYYGETLVSSSKEEVRTKIRKDESIDDDAASTGHAVTVPLGAALAIALASCAFGALACFWRTQQKNHNRKQRKNWSKIRSEMNSGAIED